MEHRFSANERSRFHQKRPTGSRAAAKTSSEHTRRPAHKQTVLGRNTSKSRAIFTCAFGARGVRINSLQKSASQTLLVTCSLLPSTGLFCARQLRMRLTCQERQERRSVSAAGVAGNGRAATLLLLHRLARDALWSDGSAALAWLSVRGTRRSAPTDEL